MVGHDPAHTHSDSELHRPNEESRAEPRLSKNVKRLHHAEKIIRDKDARPMTMNKMRSDTCMLSMYEPK